jgi:hypothetical protein
MSQGIRARLAKLERSPLFQKGSPTIGALVAGLNAELNEIQRVSESPDDQRAAAELLDYGPDSAATFAELSDQALRLARRVLADWVERAGAL